MTTYQKGARVALALAVLAAMVSQTAQAENKLFTTDVLDRGRFDLVADQYAFKITSSAQQLDYDVTSTTKQQGTGQRILGRIGVGAQTHVGVSLEYAVARIRSEYAADFFGQHFEDEAQLKAKGFQGWGMWVKHSFLAPQSSPLSLSAELHVNLETARNLYEEAHNTASATVSAGWDFGSGLKSFAEVTQFVAEHDKFGQRLFIDAGTWIPVGQRVSLIPSVTYTRYAAQGNRPVTNGYGLGLQGVAQVVGDTYVRASASLGRDDGFTTRDGWMHIDAADRTSLSVGLYHLF